MFIDGRNKSIGDILNICLSVFGDILAEAIFLQSFDVFDRIAPDIADSNL